MHYVAMPMVLQFKFRQGSFVGGKVALDSTQYFLSRETWCQVQKVQLNMYYNPPNNSLLFNGLIWPSKNLTKLEVHYYIFAHESVDSQNPC